MEEGAYRYLPKSHSLEPLTQSFGFNDSGATVKMKTHDQAEDKKKKKKEKKEDIDEEEAEQGSIEGSGECDNEDVDEGGGILEKLRNSTVPQVATMFHQEWIDNAAVIFLISGNVVRVLHARFSILIVSSGHQGGTGIKANHKFCIMTPCLSLKSRLTTACFRRATPLPRGYHR